MFIALLPLLLFLYQKVTNNLVDVGKLAANATANGTVVTIPGEWFVFCYFLFSIFFLYCCILVLLYQIIVPRQNHLMKLYMVL
jgi:hypothetical protein